MTWTHDTKSHSKIDSFDAMLVWNLRAAAQVHARDCEDPECGVSVYLLFEAAKKIARGENSESFGMLLSEGWPL